MSDLARELAQLQGWYRAEHIDPDGNGWNIWRNDEIGETVTDDEELPQPDTDPADAFNLLAYMQTFRAVSNGHVMQDVGMVSFKIYTDKSPLVEWSIWRGKYGWTEGDTLQQAIALACRDALVAIREAEGKQ